MLYIKNKLYLCSAIKNAVEYNILRMESANTTITKDPHQMSWAELKEFIASISVQMQETDRRIEESRKETDRRIEESRKEADRRFEESRKEADRRIEETDRRIEETDRLIKASQEKTDRIFRRMEKNDEKLKKLNESFVSQTGHILEGLTKRSALSALRKAGFDVRQGFKGVCGSDPKKSLNMEIDLLYLNTTEAIVVEVKTQVTITKINHFLKQMRHFRELYPQYASYVVYVAVAAISFKEGAEAYAREKGVIVIRTNDDVFTVAPLDRDKLKRF